LRNNNELGTHYKMATEVNQNFFAWSQEETSVQDLSQVISLSSFILLPRTMYSQAIYLK